MKSALFLILFITLALGAFAQQDTITVYQTPRGFFKDPQRGKWKRKLEHQDSLWVMQLFDKAVLQEKVSFADENLTERKGPYEKYLNGNLQEEGNYQLGYKKGLWKAYYPNHQLKQKVNYQWDKPDGTFTSYWENGQIKKEGRYVNGVKTGPWKMHLENGQLIADENFDARGQKISGVYFDPEGKSISAPISKAPEFNGGVLNLYRTMAGKVKYPPNAQRNKIQGKVVLAFIVKKDSGVEDIAVVSSPDPELSEEAIRVLKTLNGWIPGEELGDPVDMKYTTSVNFILHQ